MSAAPIIPIAEPAPKLEWTLFQILESIDAYLDTIDMIESDEERAQAEAELDGFFLRLFTKVDSTVEFLDFLEARQATRRLQVVRLEKANKRDQGIIDRIEQNIQRCIAMSGRDRLEGNIHTLRVRRNPPSVDVTDMSIVPEEYRRYKVEIEADKTKAKAAFKAAPKEPIAGLQYVTDRRRVERA